MVVLSIGQSWKLLTEMCGRLKKARGVFLSPTGFTGGDLWFALCLSVSQSVCHTFLDPAIILNVLHIFSWNLKNGQMAKWRLCMSFHFVPTSRIPVATATNRLEILLKMVDPAITLKVLHIFSWNLKHGQMAIWRLCTSFHFVPSPRILVAMATTNNKN